MTDDLTARECTIVGRDLVFRKKCCFDSGTKGEENDVSASHFRLVVPAGAAAVCIGVHDLVGADYCLIGIGDSAHHSSNMSQFHKNVLTPEMRNSGNSVLNAMDPFPNLCPLSIRSDRGRRGMALRRRRRWGRRRRQRDRRPRGSVRGSRPGRSRGPAISSNWSPVAMYRVERKKRS